MWQERRELQMIEPPRRSGEVGGKRVGAETGREAIYIRLNVRAESRNREVVSGTGSKRQPYSAGRKRKRRSCLDTLLRILFLVIGIIVLAYAVLVGTLLYRQQHPAKVDFDALQDSRTTSLMGVLGERLSLEEEMRELLERNEEAGFMVNDPNRKRNSEKLWDYDTLDGQIRNLWELGSW